jgi:hypothetical protein
MTRHRGLATNPDGYVLNMHRIPRNHYLMLHHVSCVRLRRLADGAQYWTVKYRKVCGTQHEVTGWAVQAMPDGEVQFCHFCLG